MVNTIYQKSFAALMKRPFRLWGISLQGEFQPFFRVFQRFGALQLQGGI